MEASEERGGKMTKLAAGTEKNKIKIKRRGNQGREVKVVWQKIRKDSARQRAANDPLRFAHVLRLITSAALDLFHQSSSPHFRSLPISFFPPSRSLLKDAHTCTVPKSVLFLQLYHAVTRPPLPPLSLFVPRYEKHANHPNRHRPKLTQGLLATFALFQKCW